MAAKDIVERIDMVTNGGVSPSASWGIKKVMDFEAQATTTTVYGESYTKISDTSLTEKQLTGAVLELSGDEITLTSEMLSNMSAEGVVGTLVTVPDYGEVLFSCTEAGSVVSEPGMYIRTDAVSYVPYLHLEYTKQLTASIIPIAVGTDEMTDGVTDLPTGVVYLQIEE